MVHNQTSMAIRLLMSSRHRRHLTSVICTALLPDCLAARFSSSALRSTLYEGKLAPPLQYSSISRSYLTMNLRVSKVIDWPVLLWRFSCIFTFWPPGQNNASMDLRRECSLYNCN